MLGHRNAFRLIFCKGLYRAQPVKFGRKQACCLGHEVVAAVHIEMNGADARHLKFSLVAQHGFNLVDRFVDHAKRFGVGSLVGLHIRLHEQAVVDCQKRIEAYGAAGRQDAVLVGGVLCLRVLCHKTAKAGHDDAVVAKQQAFNMF